MKSGVSAAKACWPIFKIYFRVFTMIFPVMFAMLHFSLFGKGSEAKKREATETSSGQVGRLLKRFRLSKNNLSSFGWALLTICPESIWSRDPFLYFWFRKLTANEQDIGLASCRCFFFAREKQIERQPRQQHSKFNDMFFLELTY